MRKRNFLLSVSIVLALILPVVASAEVIMPSEQQSSDCKSGTRSDDYQGGSVELGHGVFQWSAFDYMGQL